jgi:hypothetical protein
VACDAVLAQRIRRALASFDDPDACQLEREASPYLSRQGVHVESMARMKAHGGSRNRDNASG